MMECPECGYTHMRKNGDRRGKQNQICVACSRQFIEHHTLSGYSDEVKQLCLKMYVKGIGFRGIEWVIGVHHTTVITWVKQVGDRISDAYEPQTVSEVGELDELETFVGSKKTKSGSGQGLTTSKRAFEGGLSVTTAVKPFSRYEQSSNCGAATFMSQMVGQLSRASFQTETRL